MPVSPFFSIVVPAYNAGRFIEATLDSLLNQTFASYEVVVVDDGSTDDTLDRLGPYADRITIIRQANQGPEVARNAGIKRARGGYVVSFDADDLLFPHALEVYAGTIRQFPNPPLLLGKQIHFGPRAPLQQPSWNGKTIRCTESSCFFKKRDSSGVTNSIIVVRRDALSKVDGYQLDSFIYDDRALLFRLGVESPFLTIEYPATVAYRHHQANSTGAIKHFVRGAAAICTGERHNLYPGGRALKLDRQGLIASTIAASIRWHILPNGQCGWTQKGRAILRILFSGRLFFLSGIIRQMRKKSYFRKAHEFALPP